VVDDADVPSHFQLDLDRARMTARPRVLMLTHRLPFPPDRGDRVRSYHLLRALAQRYTVTLGAVDEQAMSTAQADELGRLTQEVVYQQVPVTRQRAHAAWSLVRGQPATPNAVFHKGLCRRLIDQHRRQPFDAVVSFCSGMLGYVQALENAGGQRFGHVLDLVDVDSAKWAAYARKTRGPMRWVYAAEARRLRELEAGRGCRIDAMSVISEQELETYRETVSTGISPVVAGNGVDLDYFSPQPQTDQSACVFTGVLSYRPNREAVDWFARRVMPLVRQKISAARFDIVGRAPSASVNELSKLPGVRVVGSVPDTRPYLANSALAVAPLRIAPGVQNKVLEAMACARPVVCSPAAASGIDAAVGRELLVADSAEATARVVCELMEDRQRAAAIGVAARQRIETRYTWNTALGPMMDLIDGVTRTKAIPIPRRALRKAA